MKPAGEKELVGRAGMSERDIRKLVYDYIGVSSDGTMRSFTRAKLDSFFHRFCDLDVNVAAYLRRGGSSRAAFQMALQDAEPREQAKIIRGVFKMIPDVPYSRWKEREKINRVKKELSDLAVRLESDGWIESPEPADASEMVCEALMDAEVLLKNRGPKNAVDRAHTALHGYLKGVCIDRGVTMPPDSSLTTLFKLLREAPEFPEFSPAVAHDEQAKRMLGSLAGALDALNTIRNRATLAHPNEMLLEPAEALLFIHLSRAVLAYVDSKLNP